jgi:hypothetical protein
MLLYQDNIVVTILKHLILDKVLQQCPEYKKNRNEVQNHILYCLGKIIYGISETR